MRHVRSRWWLSLPGLAALLAGGLNLAYMALSLSRNPVRFDSAYNLTVSRNLAEGLGFASDGLILRSGTAAAYADVAQAFPFDPSITTGPIVLGPLVLGFLGECNGVWAARVLMCLWFISLLVALALIGRRLGGLWGITAGLMAPLLFDPAMGLVNEPRGPTEVIGEIPVAALVAFAVFSVTRLPHVAALLVGFAVVTKLVAFLAAPAIVVAGAIVVSRPTVRRALIRLATMSAVVCAPLLCWQLVILLSLGRDGFRTNLDGQLAMLRSGGSGMDGGSQAWAHIRLLAGAWTFPHNVTLAAIVGVMLVLVAGAVAARSHLRECVRRLPSRPIALTAITAIAVVLTWLAWFVFLSSQNYPRYAYVPLVLGGTVVLSLLGRILTESSRRWPTQGGALACGAALLGLIGWQVTDTLDAAARPDGETLADQRAAARALQVASPDETFGFVDIAAHPSALALVANMTAVPAAERPDRPLFVPGQYLDLVELYCNRPLLYQSPSIVVCNLKK